MLDPTLPNIAIKNFRMEEATQTKHRFIPLEENIYFFSLVA